MLDHGDPAAGLAALQIRVAHVREIDFVVGLIRAGDDTAGVGVGTEKPPCCLHLGALKLAVHARVPRLTGTVFHLVMQVDGVTVTMEGVNLRHPHAVVTAPLERHFQRVTAVSQCVLTLGGGELGMMVGGIAVHRGGFTAQTRLGEKYVRRLELHEWKGRVFLREGHGIVEQRQAPDAAATQIDVQIEHVRAHADLFVGRRRGGSGQVRCRGEILTGNSRQRGYVLFEHRHGRAVFADRRRRCRSQGLRTIVLLPSLPQQKAHHDKRDQQKISQLFYGHVVFFSRLSRCLYPGSVRLPAASGFPGTRRPLGFFSSPIRFYRSPPRPNHATSPGAGESSHE